MTGRLHGSYLCMKNRGNFACESILRRGRSPYPLAKDLGADEVEYVTRWLDHYQANRSEDGLSNLGEIVGYLAEYKEQQESGKSDFKLPPIPT